MKWLLRVFRKKKRTPMPPKPYIDTSAGGKHMVDPRLYNPKNLAEIDPEKPHWQDPRFDSRQEVPFFDIWGYNRDWSWTLFKLASLIFVAVFYYEMRLLAFSRDEMPKISSTTTVSAVPDYARDNKATEEELKAAGFAFVGVKKLDNLGDIDNSG
eukprot:gene13282-9123_t